MSSEVSTAPAGEASGASEPEERIETLEARNRELERENARLRSVTGPLVTYRHGVVLFLLVSVGAAAGTFLYPGSRDVLIAVAGTGAFGAILLGMLVQEWFLSASVSRAIYDTLCENETRIASRLGVAETSRYVPTGRESLGVRLYLSRSLDDPIPPSDALGSTAVTVDGHYSLLLEPTGAEFVDLFERTNGALPEDVRAAAVALRESVVHQFELAIGAEVADLELPSGPGRNRLRVRVWGSVLGDPGRLDHPIRSFIGVGIARVVGGPVESETWLDDNENTVLVFRWGSDDPGSDDGTPEAGADDGTPEAGADDGTFELVGDSGAERDRNP